MMRQIVLGGIMSGLLFITGCLSMGDGDVDSILAKMRKAMDPDGASAKITTQVVTSRIDTPDLKEGSMVVEIKYPNQMRIRAESKDAIFMKGCDGKVGWEFSTKKGLREIKDKELDNLKFQIMFLSPKEKTKEIFESITLAGEENVKKQPCYKFICKPKSAYGLEPINIYVDKKTYLVAKTEEIHVGPDKQPIEVTRYFLNYEKTNGINFPMKIISEVGGKIIELTVKSIVWNEDLTDTAFDIPDEIK